MILILLPSFNEERGLEALLPRIRDAMERRKLTYRVLVINDGSTDGTGRVAADAALTMPVTVITHPVNRGLWETIRDGFEWAAGNAAPEDIIVRLDADDTHDPEIIGRLVEAIGDGRTTDIAIASRFAPGGGMVGVSAYRRTVSGAASLVMRTLFPIRGVRDYSCGYRAYRAQVVQDAITIFGNSFIDLRGMGFTCTVEKLLKLRSVGARVVEVPFVLQYDRKRGPSKMLSGITTLGYLVLILKNIYPWGERGREWREACRAVVARNAQSRARGGEAT